MNRLLWAPNDVWRNISQLHQFQQQIEKRYPLPDTSYTALQRWSVRNIEAFWQELWDFVMPQVSQKPQSVLSNNNMLDAQWFEGAKLNFAENLLKKRNDEIALVFANETGLHQQLTFEQLYLEVGRVQQGLKELGVSEGDRVVGYISNIPEAIVAMLATVSLGAIWSSCSPDFGVKGVCDRFGQIEPKVMFFNDLYFYNGKWHSMLQKVEEVKQSLPSIKTFVQISYPQVEHDTSNNFSVAWGTFGKAHEPEFKQLPFSHPLFIMYSSGTTGVPKCIVHGHGGTLLAHLKEHKLHGDLREGDCLFYFTTCGWMMWNWMVSGLACRAKLVLFDGQPLMPDAGVLFRLIEDEQITHFGVSPKYILSVMKSSYHPSENHTLDSLRVIYSTGAPLLPEHMDFVYSAVKKNVQLSSISGGTDIISCFMLGNPLSPVACR